MKKIIAILTLFFCCGMGFAQTYRVGDLFTSPDGSQGIVYYVHPDGSGGWVVALNDASTSCAWGTNVDVPALNNHDSYYDQNLLHDTAGYANTQILRSYQNNGPEYAAGVVDFEHGWVLPSPAQLSVLFSRMSFIENDIVAAGGSILAAERYWCSAEKNDTYAWIVDFNTGAFWSKPKTFLWHVRAVRSFSYAEPDYNYQWSTGETTPDITVNPTQTTTYTLTLTTGGGCVDTVEQTIVVDSVEPQTFYDAVCQGEPYIGNGFSLSEDETSTPGVLVRTRTEYVSGCLVTYTLELTVNAIPHTYVEQSACGSYEWNGQTYTQSGDYTFAYPTLGGCDSVVTLHLTISSSFEAIMTVTSGTICQGTEVTLQTVTFGTTPITYVQPIAIGDILCTDNSIVKPSDWPVAGKTADGIVFYVDNSGEHGWAVHLQNQESSVQWTPSDQYADIPTLTNCTNVRNAIMDLDGYNNTQKIRNAGDATQYPAAYAVDFDNGWYLPAAGQLRLLYSEIVAINNSLQIVDGIQFPMNSNWWYWSSTEYGLNKAWPVGASGVVDSTSGKANNAGVRGVRTF